jgi:excisionase family DNA binding protein
MQVNATTVPAGQVTVRRPEPKKNPRLGFTATEAAEILGVHVNTIYDWLNSNPPVLESRKIGKAHYIPRKALYSLLDEGAVA